MKNMVDAVVKCPYYKCEEKQKIFCEGVEKGTALHLTFDTPQNLKNYKKRFCKGCYNKCLIAEMQNRKWGYDAK